MAGAYSAPEHSSRHGGRSRERSAGQCARRLRSRTMILQDACRFLLGRQHAGNSLKDFARTGHLDGKGVLQSGLLGFKPGKMIAEALG